MAEQTPDTGRTKRDLLSVLGMVAVAGAAAFTSYSGLSGLAELAGWPSKLALMLPITIDAYAMTATRVWLSPARLTKKARAWARGNAIGAISMSVLGNTIYHAAAAHVLSVTWPVVVGISAIPSIVLGLTVHLWHVADDLEPEPASKKSPGAAIAEPDTVRAAYPILGGAGVSARPQSPNTPARANTPRAIADTGAGTRAKTVSPAEPRRAMDTAAAQGKAQRDAELLARACQLNDQARADGKSGAGVRQLMRDLHVSQRKAYELIDQMTVESGLGTQVTIPKPPGAREAAGRVSVSDAAQLNTPVPDAAHPAPPRERAPAAAPLDTPGRSGPDTPGATPAGVFPAQRPAPVEYANGAETPTA